MICAKTTQKYCCDDVSLIENYDKAIADTKTWHCHHRRETDDNLTNKQLIEMGLYYGRPASELIFLPPSDHISSHQKGRVPWNKGIPATDEFRKKMRVVCSGEKNPFYGKHHTDETKIKISKANKGKKRTEEERARMSEERRGDKNHFFGKTHTEESRLKMSLKRAGKNNPQYNKPWYNNGEKEAHYFEGTQPDGWVKGRIKRSRKQLK